MKSTFRKAISFYLPFLTFLALVGCGDQQQPSTTATSQTESVRVAYLPIIPDLPIFVAHERGLFEKHGLRPTLKKVAGSGNQVLETLARGDADFAYLAYSTVLEGELQAPGSFMVLQHNIDSNEYPGLYALIVSPKSGISSVHDLRNRTIGTFPGAAMLVLTKLMLSAEGIQPGPEARIVQLAPPAQVSALQTGQVDALLALEPIGALAVNAGVGAYADHWPLTPRVSPLIPTGGSVVMKEAYKTRRDYVLNIATAIDEAIDFIRQHPEMMSEYYVKYCDVPETVAKKLPVLHFWKSTEIEVEAAQAYANLLANEGVLARPINVSAMYMRAP
ncbi:ABC transporter substrate-binding protein [Endothiovibrio diazotrophicus]